MKRLFILICIAMFGSTMFGVSGHITQDTTWSIDQIVTGVLYVDAGITLTIMPGIHVTFPKIDQNADGIGDIYIEVSGRLQVQGTLSNKVIFSSNQATPARSDWLGIKYITPQSGLLSTFSNAEILYAHEPILLNGRNMTLNNVRIAYSGSYGMRINNTFLTSTLTNCTIEENSGYGLLIETGTVNITGLVLYHNGSYGLKILNASTVSASDIVSSTNTEHGIWVVGDQEASFTNCRSISNGMSGVWIDGAAVSFTNCDISNNTELGVSVLGAGANPTFINCTMSSNQFGIRFDTQPATLSYCNIENNSGYGMSVYQTSSIINNCNITNNGYAVEPTDLQTLSFPNETDWRTTGGAVVLPTASYNLLNPLSKLLYVAALTYKKDGDYIQDYHSGSIYRNWTRVMCNGINYLVNEYNFVINSNVHNQHDMAEMTLFGDINQQVSSPLDISLDLYNSGYCPNPRAWVTSINYRCITHFNIINNIVGMVANVQNNWWGQVTGIDSLVYQVIPGTANYNGTMVSRISTAGCNLANLAPMISLTAPTTMLLNPATVNFTWTDRDLDNNAMIALYYTDNPTQTGTLIAENISEDSSTNSYTWNCTGVPNGTYYIKAIISDGVNPPVTSVSTGRVMVGALEIKMPLNATGVAGTTVEIPVQTINTVDYFNIISFQFTLTYNTNIIQATGINTEGTMTGETWTVYANTNTPGQVSVNGFSTQPLNSSGNLVKIVFNVQPGAVNYSTSPLNFADCILNTGTPVPNLVNGVLRVVNQYSISGNVKYYMGTNIPIPNVNMTLTGDQTYQSISAINGNFDFPPCYAGNYVLTPSCNTIIPSLVVTPFDAALTAQFALGLYTFTNAQQKAADVNGDNQATVYDAALIAQYSVGLIPSFTPGRWGFTPPTQAYNLVSNFTNVQFLGYALGDPSGNWGSQPAQNAGEVPITIAARNGNTISIPIEWNQPFSAGYLQLRYDPEQLRYLNTEFATAIEDMQHITNSENGALRIATFGIEPVTCSEPVYNIQFEVMENSVNSPSTVYLEAVQFDEISVDFSPVEIIPEDTPILPLNLNQNYPNPFNPVTNIRYSIPQRSAVRLSVFNLKGEMVKELVNDNQNPGNYTISVDGTNLGSGIYFYRLETNIGSLVRKMVLVK